MNKYITIEGISGIGKSYFLNKIKNNLNENFVFHKEIMDEMHKGINKKIFEILTLTNSKFFDTGNPKMETLLIAAKRVNDEENAIIPALKSNKTVISDRGFDTIYIYQAIMLSKKYGGEALSYAKKLYHFLEFFCLKPNVTILLTGSFAKAVLRAEQRDHIKYSKVELEILKQASELYYSFAKEDNERFFVIDVDSLEEAEILSEITKIIENAGI